MSSTNIYLNIIGSLSGTCPVIGEHLEDFYFHCVSGDIIYAPISMPYSDQEPIFDKLILKSVTNTSKKTIELFKCEKMKQMKRK